MSRKFEPTPEQRLTVKLHKIAGTRDDVIQRLIVNPETKKAVSIAVFYRVFRDELDLGKAEVDAMCAGKLVQAIKNGEPWAICFYAKARMGFSERVTHIGAQGEPAIMQRVEVVITDPKAQ